MSVLNNFLKENKTVTIQHGNRSHNIAKTLQKALISVMSGVILIGAFPPPTAHAANLETIQTYTIAHNLKSEIDQTVKKFEGNYRLATKHLKTNKNFEEKKSNFEKSFQQTFDTLVTSLKNEKLISADLNPSLDLLVKHEVRKDASPDQVDAYADFKDKKVEINFNLLGDQTTLKNSEFRLSDKDMKVSKENMLEFIVFHEIGHLQNDMIGNFKSSKLTDAENAKISEAFTQTGTYLALNQHSISKDGTDITYLSSLNEVYADAFATISYLKMNNFSDSSIKDIEFIRDIRKDNSHRELEEAKSKGLKDANAFIDPYPTHQVMTFILENLSTMKNVNNMDVKFIAQDLSSNFVHQMVISNQGKKFNDEAIKLANSTVIDAIEGTSLKLDKGIDEPVSISFISKTMALKNMQDLRLKVEKPVFDTSIKPK